MPRVGFDPSVVNDSPAAFAAGTFVLGDVLNHLGNLYRYIKVVDITTVNGDLLTAGNADGTTGTKDRAGGSDIGELKPVGVAMGAITAGNYGFVMVNGVHAAVLDAANAATAGVTLEPHATTDGNCRNMVAGNEDLHCFGYALAAAGGGTVKARIQLL